MPEPSVDREDYMARRERQKKELALHKEQPGIHSGNLSSHLEEIRNRVFIVIFTLISAIGLCFYFSGALVKFLQAAAPEGATFFQLKPGELFMSTMKVSIYAGIVLSLPIIFSQIAGFVNPGLKDHEKKIFNPVFIASPILFYTGTIFAYYFVLPPLIAFLLGFREGIVETRYGLEHFINLELSILGICGIAFQLPIFLIIVSLLNLITSKQLLMAWRYVVLISFIVAAVLTPTPDPLTMTIVASALLIQYFGTVFILKIFKR